MRIFVYTIALATTLAAQAPPPVTPDTVVAKIDGKDVTFGDIQKILAETPPVVGQAFRQDPGGTLTNVFIERQMAGEADKLKLGEESPWREQLEVARENILVTAMMRYVGDSYQPTPEQTESYYKLHQSEYKSVKIKAIQIDFKPAQGGSVEDLKRAAEDALNAAHASTNRTEADAKKLADDIVKQARAGADFSALVEKYAEGQAKEFKGDFPSVKPNSMYPADVKQAVFALQRGEISNPLRQPTCFYVIRVMEVTTQPLNEVREDIIRALRSEHTSQYINEMRARFKPQIVRQDAFGQIIAAPAPAPKSQGQ
jgi:peptidyl-prolyl cis-trans isomerase C